MGLTVAFDRSAGEQAGLVVTYIKNGTEEEIRAAQEQGAPAHYTDWLEEESPMVVIPGTDHCCLDSGGKDSFVIAANKWGSTYGPLTDFLKAKGIEWDEF